MNSIDIHLVLYLAIKNILETFSKYDYFQLKPFFISILI